MIDKHRVPNMLTFGRLVAVPLLVAGFYLPQPAASAVTTMIFLLASATDWLDGYLARKWNADSEIGRVLDPIADKLLVVAALVPLCAAGQAPLIPTLIILLREMLISGLREGLSSRNITLHVTTLAKYKTAAQMIAVATLLATPTLGGFFALGNILLWLAAALSAWTGYRYGVASFRQLKR